ncbi:MAG: SMI1/KNR4 family protein [Alphaproteobacteria bacterium]
MSKNEIWNLLAKHAEEYPEDFTNGVEQTEIQETEKELGTKFNESYSKFLKMYGTACFCEYSVYGLLGKEEKKDQFSLVTYYTNFYKEQQNWPDIGDWYIISDDGRGNPIGVDPDGKVWLSDHDSGFEQVLLAEDFEEFLYKLYTETLYE